MIGSVITVWTYVINIRLLGSLRIEAAEDADQVTVSYTLSAPSPANKLPSPRAIMSVWPATLWAPNTPTPPDFMSEVTIKNTKPILHSHFLVRRVPPHFAITPELKYEVKNGGDLNITCVAVGSPMPFVKWREGQKDLTPDNAVPIGKNVLMLTNIRTTATYTCVAASKLGIIETQTVVKVQCKSLQQIY